MPPCVLLATLDEAGLERALTSVAGDLRFVYLESETETLIAPFSDYGAGRLPALRWTVGRAFGPTLEVRWRRDDLNYDAQALSEGDIAPLAWTTSAWDAQLDPLTRARDVLLAGVNTLTLPVDHVLAKAAPDGGMWFSESIARPLRYPVSDPRADRVTLRCVDYLAGRLVVLTRLVDLVPYAPSP